MGFGYSVGVTLLVTSGLISLGKCNEGDQQPNKAPGPGLYNSIGESINTPGKAMPTQIHLPHEENPSLILKDSVTKLATEHEKHDDALGHEDETIKVRPPWRKPHHFWLMHQEKKRRQRARMSVLEGDEMDRKIQEGAWNINQLAMKGAMK